MAENITTILDKAELTDSQASDKFYVMRGTGSDRDRNSTLATILAGAPFSAATRGLRDENAQWKVFTPANGTIDTGTWAQNSIVQMQAWEDTITNFGATIKNAVMILIPRWGTVGTAATATSCTFQHAFPGAPDITITIPAGNIAVISFGSSGGVQEYHCIPSSNSAITAAIFKSLTVSGTLSLPNNSITTAMIADLAVTAAKIASKTITYAQIADKTITDAQIANLAIGTSELANGAVIEGKLNNLCVTTLKIADLAVTTAKLADTAVTQEKIADGAVSLIKLSAAAKLQWRHCFSFSSSVLTPSGITSAYVACPRTLIEGYSLRIVVRSDTWSTTLEVMSIVIGGQTFTNLTSGWIYKDECYILDNVPITSQMCVDFIDISINTANFAAGQLVMAVQQYA